MASLHDLDGVDDFLLDCVQIEPEALQEEFIRIPADLAYWNAKYTTAYKALTFAKIAMERTAARITLEIRAVHADDKPKITEGFVEAKLLNMMAYQTMQEAHAEAEVEKVRLHGVLEAIRAKRDMIISIGAHVRAEMGGDPVVRSRVSGYREQQESRK